MRGNRGKSKFTLAQREACYVLMLQNGVNQHSAAEILTNVGYGELPPFKISPASVYRISRELRATRTVGGVELAKTAPVDAVDHLISDAIKLAQRALRRLEIKENRGELEPDELRRWTACLRDLRTQAAKVRPRPQEPHSEAENAGDEERSETDWLGAEDRDPTGDTSVSPPTTETDHAETHDHVPTHKGSSADSAAAQLIPIEHANTQPLEPTHSA